MCPLLKFGTGREGPSLGFGWKPDTKLGNNNPGVFSKKSPEGVKDFKRKLIFRIPRSLILKIWRKKLKVQNDTYKPLSPDQLQPPMMRPGPKKGSSPYHTPPPPLLKQSWKKKVRMMKHVCCCLGKCHSKSLSASQPIGAPVLTIHRLKKMPCVCIANKSGPARSAKSFTELPK